jgi:hypothetical protein
MAVIEKIGVAFSKKECLIAVVNVEYDDNNYRTFKSATQQEFNSSNADW